jgi:hypothetical protein
MYDKGLVVDIVQAIVSSMESVLKRFRAIRSSDDFVKDEEGREKLDAICMQLRVQGTNS